MIFSQSILLFFKQLKEKDFEDKFCYWKNETQPEDILETLWEIEE